MIVSWARFSGSCACSRLNDLLTWILKGECDIYSAAAAPACPLLCCHRRSNGDFLAIKGPRELDTYRVALTEFTDRYQKVEGEGERNCR